LKSKPYIGHVTEKDRSEGRTSQKKKKRKKEKTRKNPNAQYLPIFK
jgi:hypothetical protein